MKTLILILLLIPVTITGSEFKPLSVTWKAGIAIDLSGVPADKRPSLRIVYKKGWANWI